MHIIIRSVIESWIIDQKDTGTFKYAFNTFAKGTGTAIPGIMNFGRSTHPVKICDIRWLVGGLVSNAALSFGATQEAGRGPAVVQAPPKPSKTVVLQARPSPMLSTGNLSTHVCEPAGIQASLGLICGVVSAS